MSSGLLGRGEQKKEPRHEGEPSGWGERVGRECAAICDLENRFAEEASSEGGGEQRGRVEHAGGGRSGPQLLRNPIK